MDINWNGLPSYTVCVVEGVALKYVQNASCYLKKKEVKQGLVKESKEEERERERKREQELQ
jgi:hypothetical protein